MRRTAAVVLAAVIALSVVPTAGAEEAPAADAAVAPAAGAGSAQAELPMPVIREEVPLPDQVRHVDDCQWTRDGEALLCKFKIAGVRLVQVGFIRPDGSDFACLTCDAGLTKAPQALQALDSKRFIFAIGSGSESGTKLGVTRIPMIGECAPSLADCADLVVKEVKLPTIEGSRNERSLEVSPDGRHLLWTVLRTDGFLMLMGDLAATAEGYEVRDVRVLNAVRNPRSAEHWATRTAWYETKTFHRGGTMLFSSSRAGGFNLDVYSLDFQTGRTTRLTTNPEWDEDAHLDPTGRYLVTSSTRRLYNSLRAGSLAGYPGFLDAARVIVSVGSATGSEVARDHTVASARWLTTMDTERSGGDGMMLNAYECACWRAGGEQTRWNPKGDRVVQTETERGSPWEASRIMIIRFPTLPAQPADCVDPDSDRGCQTPTPNWAPLLSDYPILPAGEYRVPGPRGGSATLEYGWSVAGPSRVELDGFTAEDGRVFTGIMEVTGISNETDQTYAIDLAISGRHTGSHTTQITKEGRTVCGTVETVLDGRSLHTNVGQWKDDCGFPRPASCPSGADVDATPTGDCSRDQWPPSFAPPGGQ